MPDYSTMDIPKLKEECQLECLYSDRCMAFSWNFALGATQMGVCHFKRYFQSQKIFIAKCLGVFERLSIKVFNKDVSKSLLGQYD